MIKKFIPFLLSLSLLVSAPIQASAASECTGGTITYSGGNTIHIFTSNGLLDCTGAGGGNVKALVVGGGGGGGGFYRSGGGGGAGAYQYDAAYPVTGQIYSVTIGAGGAGSSNNTSPGNTGGSSVFDSITAVGGGGGGSGGSSGSFNGVNGGSAGGGGGAEFGPGNIGTGGSGTQAGGNAFSGNNDGGGGGGGSSGSGTTPGNVNPGNGGSGTVNSISGSSVTYAGGGGGGYDGLNVFGIGGTGGGGNSGYNNGVSNVNPTNGTANTGGGGGGSGGNIPWMIGGNGGSGIVIISYPTNSLVSPIFGSGILNRIAKFISTTTIAHSLLSDDGLNITVTAGNLFMQVGSLIDSVTNGALNFGTTLATTMTFGRSGQNMLINSKVGISTTTPTADLEVNGNIFANFINVLANGLGLDTYTSGALSLGSTTATSIKIGRSGITTTVPGLLSVGQLSTVSNCNSTASPAVCGSAPAGSVAMATGGSTLQVKTTAVTANSQIFVQEDSSLGARLGIICNTGTNRSYTITSRAAGTFTISSTNNPVTNKACLSYFIVN